MPTDPYTLAEREAIQWADGIVPEAPKPTCEAVAKLEAHRQKVIADKAEKHAKKYGTDRKSLGGNDGY